MIEAKNTYLNGLARQYTSGQANLYEVRIRVNNDEISDMLNTIGWIHCGNSSAPGCVMKHANFLMNLDSDQDGIIDLSEID